MFANARSAFLSLVLVAQLVVPARLLAAPMDLDLSSNLRNITATATGVIREGGGSKRITPNMTITPAEQLALFQVLNSGRQTVVLNSTGAAVRGVVAVNSALAASGISNLVVPKGVTVVDSLANLGLTGGLTNAGKFYAFNTNPAITAASIGATGILNQQTGLISTVLPRSGVPGTQGANPNLSLNLSALGDITNYGKIISAGSLSATAGGAIINGRTSATTTSLMQAVRDVNLSSGANAITNAGAIASLAGNINVGYQNAATMTINNSTGLFQSANGSINVRDAGFAGKYDLNILGGDFLSKTMNLFSGDGTVNMSVKNVTGIVNVNAGSAHVVASSAQLRLGDLNLTGDPTFYNTMGDIVLSNDLSFPGQDVAIIASGNIIANGCQVINTSSFNAGGQITMIAGAHVVTSGQNPTAMPPLGDSINTVTVDAGTINGGKIDLAGVPISSMSSVGQFNAGGNVTLVAYGGQTTGSGQVLLPSNVTITTGSGGTDLNGNVTIIAGATTGTAIQVGGINTQGANNGSGNIYMLTNNPTLTGCSACTGNVQYINGKLVSGAFNTNANMFPAPGNSAAIATGDLSSTGGAVQLLAGGSVSTGNINSTGAASTGKNGGVAIVAGQPSGNAITTGSITTSGATAASGNVLLMTAAPRILCSTCQYSSLAADTAGNITAGAIVSAGNVDVRAGGDFTAPAITANGAGSRNGGQVGIIVDNSSTMTHTFNIGGSGVNSVGMITVAPGTSSQGGIGIISNSLGGINVTNQNALNISAIAAGSGGQIGLNAKNGNLTTPGIWSLNATGQGTGGFLNLAGKTITFTTDLQVSANGAGSNSGANGGKVQISADALDLPTTPVIITANGSGSRGAGGTISLLANNTESISTDMTISARGTGTGTGGTVNVTSNGTLAFGNGTVSIDVGSDNMLAGTTTISGGAIQQGAANLVINASANGGGGGLINWFGGSWSATTGSVTVNANSQVFGGGGVNINLGSMSGGSGAVVLNCNSAGGFGGFISMNTGNVSTGTGNMTMSANGSLGGGRINATLDSFAGNGVLAFNANAVGTSNGAGGFINVRAPKATDSLAFGTQAGQISASATGYAVNGASGDGGTILVSTGANLSVDGSGIALGTSAPTGNGGTLNLAAGTAGQGVLQITGNLSVNGAGGGNGGNISLSYADNNPMNSVNNLGQPVINVANISASAPGAGMGGIITISSNALLNTVVGIANNGSLSVSSASGAAGSVIVLSAGSATAPTQDAVVMGSGTFNGPLLVTAKNVTFNLTNQAPFTVAKIQAIGGNLSMSVPNVVLNNTSVLSSTGSVTLNVSTLANDSTITAGTDMTISSSAGLAISGSGTLQATTITMQAAGAVNASQNTYTGTVAGTAGTSFSITSNAADLTVGSITANLGNVNVITNAGNLTIAANSTITANEGNVLFEDNGAGGIITFSDSVTVTAKSTSGTAGTGEIFVAIGSPPTSPVAGTLPQYFTENLLNGGQVYFGTNSITSACCNHTANVDNSEVVFDTGAASATSIVLTSNDTFNATNQIVSPPPPPPPPPGPTPNPPPGQGGIPPGHGGTPPGLNGNPPPGHGGTPPGLNGNPPPGHGGPNPSTYKKVGFFEVTYGDVVVDTGLDGNACE